MGSEVKRSTSIHVEGSDKSTGFPDLGLTHLGCAAGAITRKTAYEDNSYLLRCSCGLEISLPKLGEAVQVFQRTAVDGQARSLPKGSFVCAVANEIVVTGKK